MTTLSSICYHYLARKDDFKRIWGHTFELFKEHIEFLKNKYDIINPKDLLAGNFEDGKNYLLLTFDDGLKDHVQIANYLDQSGLKGIFAVPSCILRDEPANPQIIHFGTAYYGVRNFYNFASREIQKNFSQSSAILMIDPDKVEVEDLLKKIKHIFKRELPPEIARTALLNIYHNQIEKAFPNFMEMVHLSKTDIENLVLNGHVLAAHSDTHLVIKDIEEDRNLLTKEIVDSKKALSDLIGSEVKIFAYPFGGSDEILGSPDYLKKNGYDLVLTTYRKQAGLDLSDLGRYLTFSTERTDDLSRNMWHYTIK